MKLNVNVVPAIATGFALTLLWGYAESPETRAAWYADEVAAKTWTIPGIARGLWGERREVDLPTSWVPYTPAPDLAALWSGAPPQETLTPLAFTGAEGYGREALAVCRDSVYYGPDGIHDNADDWPLVVHVVDTATYQGACGSSDSEGGIQDILRNDVADKQLDYVIFQVGGQVRVCDADGGFDRYDLELDTDCVFITGMAAQGSEGTVQFTTGFADRRHRVTVKGANVSDIVLRNVRSFNDSSSYNNTPSDSAGQRIIGAIRGGDRILIDHVSWHGGDDGYEIYPLDDSLRDITLSNNLFGGVGFYQDPQDKSTMMAIDFGEGIDSAGSTDLASRRFSLLRNGYIGGSHRMPALGHAITLWNPEDTVHAGEVEAINEGTYDAYGNRARQSQSYMKLDAIGIQIKHGSAKAWGRGIWWVRDCYNADDCASHPLYIPASYYISDIDYYESSSLVKEDSAVFTFEGNGADTGLPDSVVRGSRNASSTVTEIWPAADVFDSLFTAVDPRRLAGAVLQVTCGGSLTTKKDSTWLYFQSWVEGDSAGSASAKFRGFGDKVYYDTIAYEPGSACADADGDGLPDLFETWSGLQEPDSLIAGLFAIDHYLNGDSALLAGGPPPPPPDFAPTYRAGVDTVWVRQLAASLQPPYDGAVDSYPMPTYPDSTPSDATGSWVPDTLPTPAEVLHFTCDSTITGATPLDSAAFRAAALAMGLDPDALMGYQPTGCSVP